MVVQDYAGSLFQTYFLKMVFLFLCFCTLARMLKCMPHLVGNGFKSAKLQGLPTLAKPPVKA